MTGGCSAAYKPCGPGKGMKPKDAENWEGTPCCQFGCECDYNMTGFAQCKPPKGLWACTKEAQKKPVHHHSVLYDKEEVSDVPSARNVPWLVAGAGSLLLVASMAMIVRKKRTQGSRYDEAVTDAEADAESS